MNSDFAGTWISCRSAIIGYKPECEILEIRKDGGGNWIHKTTDIRPSQCEFVLKQDSTGLRFHPTTNATEKAMRDGWDVYFKRLSEDELEVLNHGVSTIFKRK